MRIDWVAVRPYVSSEPAVSVGSEQLVAHETVISGYSTNILVVEQSGNAFSNVAVRVELNTTTFFDWGLVRSDGVDIMFIDEQGNGLQCEVESWNYASRKAVMWVKVPSIPAYGTVPLRMLYSHSALQLSSFLRRNQSVKSTTPLVVFKDTAFYTSTSITLDLGNGTKFSRPAGWVQVPLSPVNRYYWASVQVINGKMMVTPVFVQENLRWYTGTLDLNVTFTFRQYGTNYRVIEIRDVNGNIIGRRWLDVNNQAFMPLPYGVNVFLYLIDIDKKQSKLYGSFTVSSASYVFTIMPPPPPSVYPGNLTAVFESNSSTLHVWGSCRSPPCILVVKKWNTTGLFSVYTLTITTSSFDAKITMSDPYTIVELQSSNGTLLARGFTGSTTIMNATIASEFNTLLSAIAEHTIPNGDVRWLVVLVLVLTFLVFTTVGDILIGTIAMSMMMAFLGWITGWMPVWGGGVTILLFTAVLYYITRRW